jgi:hypothetical protein
MASPIPSDLEISQQTHYRPSVLTRNVISKSSVLVLLRIQQVISVTALGLLVWLWIDASKNHTPRATYPYYDTQQPVPPWSEPPPLEGNYVKTGEHR